MSKFSKQTRYSESTRGPHHEKHKSRKNFNHRKIKIPRGTLGTSEVEKIFCRNFANKLYIRSSYGVLIRKNTKLEKILTIEKLTPQGGTLGSKKLFVKIFQKKTIYSESTRGPHHKKHKIIKNCKNRKNDPQGGPLDPKNAKFSNIEFRAEPSIFLIYIL